VVEIGGHRLALIEAPAGFDLAIRVELSSTVRAADFERAFRTDLTGTWLSQRFASWTLLVLVVAFGFAMPLATALMTRPGHARPDHSDVFWSTGPLTPNHAQAAHNNCNVCHERFFAAVPDRTCVNCHAAIRDHVDAHHRQIVGTLGQQTCGQCHREHNGARGSLVNRADRLCVGCHGDPSVNFESVSLEHVRQFASGGHPEFKATLLQAWQAPGRSLSETTWRSSRVPLAKASQQSNLTFSHEAHLAGAPVTREGAPLECRDCHVLAADGARFVPTTMAGACASCHSLTFDEEVTDRQLPHGTPQQEPGCTAATLDCGLRNASNAVAQLFGGDRGCAECHRIEDSHRGPDTDRFVVAPVRLTQDFFPNMHFSHRAHQVQKDLTGDAACEACHEVRHSKSSADVRLPGLDRCLQCHADRVATDRVELRCVSCHVYHPAAIDTNTAEPGVAQR
jgi:predicted CXXCH cytochrome family protein